MVPRSLRETFYVVKLARIFMKKMHKGAAKEWTTTNYLKYKCSEERSLKPRVRTTD